MKDAREKLVQRDARFNIRGRGGAGTVHDARQMINSRKQGQFSAPAQPTLKSAILQQLQSKAVAPQIQMHTNNNLVSPNTWQFTPSAQRLSPRVSASPQLSSNVRVMDARDRLSLKRSIGGTQTQAIAAPPLKLTKTIQVRGLRKLFLYHRSYMQYVNSMKRESMPAHFLRNGVLFTAVSSGYFRRNSCSFAGTAVFFFGFIFKIYVC